MKVEALMKELSRIYAMIDGNRILCISNSRPRTKGTTHGFVQFYFYIWDDDFDEKTYSKQFLIKDNSNSSDVESGKNKKVAKKMMFYVVRSKVRIDELVKDPMEG